MSMRLLLKCGNIQETKSFYDEIFEFNVSDTAENTCTVEKEGSTIIFTDQDLWAGYPKCTGTIYVYILDVNAYYNAIKDKAIIRWPIVDMSYGTREFGVKDCNEYTIAFAQEI